MSLAATIFDGCWVAFQRPKYFPLVLENASHIEERGEQGARKKYQQIQRLNGKDVFNSTLSNVLFRKQPKAILKA